MPLLNGYDTSKQIRSREWNHRDIPIITLSSSTVLEQKAEAIAAGMNDFICKLFPPRNLFSKINEYA